ncbi:MAG: hypothetical protein JJE41_16470 [Candidatus Heimdallarchaeota archaeon]|nr:hypothetical protein [Candidatus Heimdallarchaeota archaeon]
MKAITRKQRRLVEKYTDPSYSLLDERWRRQKRIYLSLGWILSVLFFLSGLGFLVIYYQVKRSYLYAKELFEEGNTKKLLEMARWGGAFGTQSTGAYGRMFSIYALVDLKNLEVAQILKDRLHELRFYSKMFKKPYRYPLEVLAIKLDYSTPERLLSKLDSVKETQEDTIPITKVYFVKKIPKGTQCMVSSLPLDINEDDIVACPFCGNMAQREHLSGWLTTNNHCPVCRRTIKIVDCPIVKIQK